MIIHKYCVIIEYVYFIRSCVGRERVGETYTSDLTWMSLYPTNPLNVGQYVNNHTKGEWR